MKKGNLKKIIAIYCIFILMLFIPSGVVSVPTTISLEGGWEDINAGVSNCTSEYIEVTLTRWDGGEDDMEVTNAWGYHGSDKSFKIYQQASYQMECYWNLTQTWSYVSNITVAMKMYYHTAGSGNNNMEFKFFNSSGDAHIRIQVNEEVDGRLMWYDTASGWRTLDDSWVNLLNDTIVLDIGHVIGNEFDIKVYNDAGALKHHHTNFASAVPDDWTNFDGIRLDKTGSNAYTWGIYVDNLNITTDVAPDPYEPPEGECEWFDLDDEWDGQAIGQQNGTVGYFGYQIADTEWGDTFHVDNNRYKTGTRALYTKWDDGDHDLMGWCNLTGSWGYMEKLSFWFYIESTKDFGTTEVNFFDGDDTKVLAFKFDDAANSVSYYDATSGWQTLISPWQTYALDEWIELRIEHIDNTNLMNYSVYNESGFRTGVDDASASVNDWYNFEYIEFDNPTGLSGDELIIYFDDFDVYICNEPAPYTPPDPPWTQPESDEWGYVTVGLVMNESAPWQNITTYDLLVSDYAGTYTFFCDDCVANQSINISILPWGYDVVFQLSADGYHQRLYYKDINPYNAYNFQFYLPPVTAPTYNGTGDDGGDNATTKLYFVQVIDEGSNPVAGAKVTLKRYMNYTSSWNEIGSVISGGYGYASIYLRPNTLYKAFVNETGYEYSVTDWVTDPNYHGLSYPLVIQLEQEEDDFDDYHFDDWVSWNASINATDYLFVNFTDSLNNTDDFTVLIWEYNHSTGAFTNFSWNRTTYSNYTDNMSINSSNTYYVYLFLNHSNFGYLKFQKVFVGGYTPAITQDEFDEIVDKILKFNPFGWSNFFMFLVICVVYSQADREDLGWTLIFIGGIFYFINYLIGFNTLFVTHAGGVVPILLIIGGIFILWDDSRKVTIR